MEATTPTAEGQPPSAAPSGDAQPSALVEAMKVLQGHQGPIADLLKDPTTRQHLQITFAAVKQDPGALQALTRAGIGPPQIAQFEQMLQPRPSASGPPATSWLGPALGR